MDSSDHRKDLFALAFEALTNHRHLRWQRRLFERLVAGKLPSVCDLPTGLGKTSVIPIWLIAFAVQAQTGEITLPRRLIYIVNRRTVVDQATNIVQQIRERLLQPADDKWMQHEPTLAVIAKALRESSGSNDALLAVSTLRGELADNEEWKADPTRPAIMIGTIDMIGSKLLFSGYGDGRYWRAQHAGLVGQDSLVVHDEAHLTPAFSRALYHIADTQRASGELRPLHILELSATARNAGSQDVVGLEAEDQQDDFVRRRLSAEKYLHLHQAEATELPGKLVELSRAHETGRAKVLIYVRSPEQAQKIASELRKQLGDASKRVALLTGTMRGHERDRFASCDPIYRAFLDGGAVPPASVYLVSTSAGEVGIDLDADHMVCDLTTLNAMIQRLGRVNRQGGEGRIACIDVVEAKTSAKDRSSELDAIATTERILSRWAEAARKGAVRVSPGRLRTLMNDTDPEQLRHAFAPEPAVPPLSDILLDAWSLTSITGKLPGRPEVADYLHGLTNDPPETYVAWRREIRVLSAAEAGSEAVEDWFLACPVLSHERLRDRSDRVKNALASLLDRYRKSAGDPDLRLVALNERGDAEWRWLSEIVRKNFRLEYRTIVLPVEAGGLSKDGTLDPKADNEAPDVAQETESVRRERWIEIKDEAGRRYQCLTTGEIADSLPDGLRERERVILQEAEDGQESRHLLVMVGAKELAIENPETAKFRQPLSVHSDSIAAHMEHIASMLGLEASLKEALVTAAQWPDRGKNRDVWQRFACNPSGEPLAKSTKYLHGRALGGYQHEFGSLLEAAADPEIQAHPGSDLILHLIAAHHGWARPHFEPRAQDPKHTSRENKEAAGDVMRRFGHLQQRFGRWGLAWLESLLRCADIAASKQSEALLKPSQSEDSAV